MSFPFLIGLSLLSGLSLGQDPSTAQIDERATISTCLIVIVLLVVFSKLLDLIISKLVKRKSPISSSLTNMCIGMLFGIVLDVFKLNNFTSTLGDIYQDVFMTLLLPVILFNSAISLNKSFFFKNIRPILLFAFGATFISILILTSLCLLSSQLELGFSLPLKSCIVFSVLLAGTDVVGGCRNNSSQNRNLTSVIGGEALLNDAVSLAVFAGVVANKFEGFGEVTLEILQRFGLAISGSILIGLTMGLFCSLIIKKISNFSSEYQIEVDKMKSIKKNSLDFQEMETFKTENRIPEVKFSSSENLQSQQSAPESLDSSYKKYVESSQLKVIHEEDEDSKDSKDSNEGKNDDKRFNTEKEILPSSFAKEYRDLKNSLNSFRNQELVASSLIPLICYLLSEVI